MVAIPRGTPVTGRVVDAKDATHFSGSSLLSIEITQIELKGQPVGVSTAAFSQQGKGRGKNTAMKTGGGAALGAIIGALAGGGKGAAIGAASGGGLGAGVNAVTRGEQVKIPAETLVNFKLQSPISVGRRAPPTDRRPETSPIRMRTRTSRRSRHRRYSAVFPNRRCRTGRSGWGGLLCHRCAIGPAP